MATDPGRWPFSARDRGFPGPLVPLLEGNGHIVSRSSSIAQRSDNPILRYIRETRAELAKVTWPSREEGLRLTVIVLIVTAVSSVFLWAVDTLFSFLIAQFLRLV